MMHRSERSRWLHVGVVSHSCASMAAEKESASHGLALRLTATVRSCATLEGYVDFQAQELRIATVELGGLVLVCQQEAC
jgi:hypothetical protein